MYFTNDDITWYDSASDGLEIIDSCGEFSNVHLIGTQDGINYNPALTRRQLGFPLKDKPNNVKKRALELKMLHACERPISMVVAEPSTHPNQDVEELEFTLAKMKQERDLWEEQFHALNQKQVESQLELKYKDALIEILEEHALKRERDPEDLFSSSIPQYSESTGSNSCNSSANDYHLKVVSTPVSLILASQPAQAMPSRFLWGMPPNFMPEGYAPTIAPMSTSRPIMSTPSPILHALLRVKETIYHSEPFEGPDMFEKTDEMKYQLQETKKELKTLRGKDLFGKSAAEICLPPNVKIPVKYKVPDFEKDKGNTCPLSHLVMYAHKMLTQVDNDQFLIHYFQDSLAGAVLRSYTGLNSGSVCTFNDSGEALVKQYKYTIYMAPDHDQLRSMSQKDKEMFKEYSQSSPNDFTEMVNMGMHLEEGVREVRLSKEEASTSKKYGGSFSKKKERETNSVSVGREKRPHVRKNFRSQQHHHQVSYVIPHNNFEKKKVTFDHIPMTYAEHYPSLVIKNLIQPKNPPHTPEPLPWWYKPDQHCTFHQGEPDYDIENCYPLKYEVQKLVKSGMVSFEDRAPNVKANSVPAHGNSYVNMVDDCPGKFRVFDVRRIQRSLVEMHRTMCLISDYEHDHDGCVICSVNPQGLFKTHEQVVIQYDNIKISDISVFLLVIRLADPIPYASDKAVPYKYSATMIKDGQEVPLPAGNSVVSIADVVKSGESSRSKVKDDDDEVLRLIKKTFWITIFLQAYVEHDVTVDQFDHIVANITSCNNLSFSDEELPEEGRNHNLALHISRNCKEDALSNVLVGTVDLPIKIGLCAFQVTFQVMDIHPVYSCLLGRPWIHEASVVTSTLHQKLKCVKNGKLVVMEGEKAILVSHVSSFTYVEAEEEVGTPIQALSISYEVHKTRASMSSLKDA
ncbi:hypothetical protein KIW84_012779 [Lathyrus oleraceus]|uniref:DUF7745 domain-containing protein n=1 Tax=Pisum sativum TaxID=3888 RepID=A0A9D5BIC8_PEA|nr:hypothetical protein KIW84_012779 [Pisum sativum]